MMNNTVVLKKKRLNTRTMTMIAMLSGISFVLAFFEFPVPLSPSFARMDLSDLPALIGAFAFGPIVGVMVELLKNLLQLLSTSTGGVGELANFLMGGTYVYIAGIIYSKNKNIKTAWSAVVVSSITMGIMAAITNYYILLPVFEQFMPVDQLIASFGEFIPFIKTKADVVIFNAFPFNVLKGLAIGLITTLIYKKLSPLLKEIK